MHDENKEILEIYNSEIDLAIAEACDLLGIEDLNKETQTRWKAVCQYVGQRVFQDRRRLKDTKTYLQKDYGIMSTYNRYNQELISDIFEYYVFLSRKYDKMISIIAFSELINIPYETIKDWEELNKLNSCGSHLVKRIKGLREDNLKDMALDNGNVMGIFQVGRREYAWDVPGVANRDARPALSAADLPRLDGENVRLAQTKGTED